MNLTEGSIEWVPPAALGTGDTAPGMESDRVNVAAVRKTAEGRVSAFLELK